MALYASQSVSAVKAILPAADVVDELAGGAEQLLNTGSHAIRLSPAVHTS